MRHLQAVGRLLLCALVLAVVLPQTVSAQVTVGSACGPVPSTFPIVGGTTGGLDFGGSPRMNSSGITGSGHVVRTTGARTNAAVTLPPLDPASFPSFSGSVNANSSPVAPGTYASVNVNSAGFTFTGGTYYIGTMNVNSSSFVLGPGVYYIRSLSFNDGTTVTISPAGPVKIYLGSSMDQRNNLSFNASGSTENLALFYYGNRTFDAGNFFTFNGLLYTPGTGYAKFGNDARITGAVITRGEIDFGNNLRFTSTTTTQAAIGSISTCATTPTVTPATLTAEYRLDECSYSGASGEVRDSVGSAHGTPRNGVSSVAVGEVGRAAGFDKFDRWVSLSTRLQSTWSVSTWIQWPLSTDGGSQYHVLAATDGGGDVLYLDNRNNFLWGVYTASATVDGTYRFGSLSDGWHHIAVVASGGRTTLYVDGSPVDSVNHALGAGTLTYLGTSFDYVDTSLAQGWRGALDEFQVWNGALTASEVRSIYTNQAAGNNFDGTRRAAVSCGPSRFTVTASGTASTCAAHSVTITAVDGSGSVVTTYTGTINLTTSTSRGSWAAGPSSGTVTETGTANDGAASYTFRSADLGSVTLRLTNQSADTLTVTATDSSNSAVNGVSGSVAFRDNAFVITATDSLSTTAVAARPHAMTATLFRRDTSLPTPNCSIATNYTGARNLKAWYTTDTSHPAGASAPAINGGTALGTAVPGANNVALTFTAGVATFNLTTTDVGKYTVSLRDDSRTFAGAVNIDGTSPTLTVRPFAIAVTGVAKGATANPEGTATSGSRFIAAGDTFSATVGGYLWATGDDANNDGTPDAGANFLNNGLAPRFAWATTLSTANTSGLFTPSGGILGTLGGTTSIASGSFSGGSATVSNLTYSEVGSVSLTATATSYLNTSGVTLTGTVANATTGQTARVGRFYPSHFALASGAAVTPSCSSGGFTYMGEPALGVRFTLEARNLADAVTTNYRASVYNVGTVSLAAENADAGTDLGARVTGLPSATWTLGQYAVNATGATFSRLTSPDGPFDSLLLGVAVTDADGAVITGRDMNASTAGACSGACTARALNPSAATRVRFGRLRVGNALGSPQLELPVPLTTEYWTGVGFATNSLDGCTRLTNTQFAFSNYRTPLAACATSGSPTGSSGIVFSSGRGTLRLSRPATTGSVDLTPNLGASASGNTCSGGASSAATAASRTWLQGNWGVSTYDRNPTARAVFGLHNRSQDVIFSRESY
jgi:hypothetical protein